MQVFSGTEKEGETKRKTNCKHIGQTIKGPQKHKISLLRRGGVFFEIRCRARAKKMIYCPAFALIYTSKLLRLISYDFDAISVLECLFHVCQDHSLQSLSYREI